MEAKDYLSDVVALLKKSQNTTEGMKAVVDSALFGMNEIDEHVADLMAQRSRMVDIISYSNQVATLVGGEAIVGFDYPGRRPDNRAAARQEALRETVMNLAKRGSERDGEVTDQWIIRELQDEPVIVPWKNPKAVIATMLIRSREYEKVEPGRYRRKAEVES